MIFVAVSKEVEKCRSNLVWALDTFRGKRFYILHIHQPAKRIDGGLGAKVLVAKLDERKVRRERENEEQEMHNTLDIYLRICSQRGVQATKLYFEMDSVEKGIVELISQHGIRHLVVGVAAKRNVTDRIKSSKVKYLVQHAPDYCEIQFISKGNYLFTRQVPGQIREASENSTETRPDSDRVTYSRPSSSKIKLDTVEGSSDGLDGPSSGPSSSGCSTSSSKKPVDADPVSWDNDQNENDSECDDLFSLPAGSSGRSSIVELESPPSTFNVQEERRWRTREEIEELLAKERKELERVKTKRHWLMEELHICEAVEKSSEIKIQRLQMELDNELKETEGLNWKWKPAGYKLVSKIKKVTN